MGLCEKHLHKAEDSDVSQYTKLANSGMMLAYPVKVNGKDKRPDNNVIYHSTIKLFDPAKDHAHKAHEIAQHLPLNPPDAKDIEIEPVTLQGRTGYTMHALKLKGPHTEKMKEHNSKFTGMGFPQNQVFEPHITVDKDLWEHVSKNKIKTAHEAGISFGHAELRQGPNALKTYHHETDSNEPKVPDHSDFTSKVRVPVTKSEDDGQQRYHIHSNGVRVTKSPLTIGEIKTTTGKFPKDIEKNPNIKVIPHYSEVKRSESEIKSLIKKEHALHSRFAKAFALTGDTLKKYIEDNRDLQKALEGK